MKKYNLIRKTGKGFMAVHAIEDNPEATHTVCGSRVDLSYDILRLTNNNRIEFTKQEFLSKGNRCLKCERSFNRITKNKTDENTDSGGY